MTHPLPVRHLFALLCRLASHDGPSGYWTDVLDCFLQTYPDPKVTP